MSKCVKHDWYGSLGGTHGVPVPPCPWCMQGKLRERIAELETENQRLRELGGKVADELDACRNQLCKMVLGGEE